MKRVWPFLFLGIFLLIASRCASQNVVDEPSATPTSVTPGPASVSAGMSSFFAVDEVGLGPNGYVALTNFTDAPTSLEGLYLCQGSDCFELPEVVVAAGETARIAVGNGAGHENVVATGATLGQLRPADGEIALLASSETDDPGQMLVYFQWGSTPHALTQTAIDAGLWVKGGYGPSSENATRLYKVPESGLWLFDEP